MVIENTLIGSAVHSPKYIHTIMCFASYVFMCINWYLQMCVRLCLCNIGVSVCSVHICLSVYVLYCLHTVQIKRTNYSYYSKIMKLNLTDVLMLSTPGTLKVVSRQCTCGTWTMALLVLYLSRKVNRLIIIGDLCVQTPLIL